MRFDGRYVVWAQREKAFHPVLGLVGEREVRYARGPAECYGEPELGRLVSVAEWHPDGERAEFWTGEVVYYQSLGYGGRYLVTLREWEG